MGYNLTIGEAKVHVDHDDLTAYFDVDGGVWHGDAPRNSSDSRKNNCYPSYSGWSAFCKRAGLYDVFFGIPDQGISGLLQQHPGCVRLTESHLNRFKNAQQYYKASAPKDDVEYDHRRLDWLVYWTEWALENCEHPAFANG